MDINKVRELLDGKTVKVGEKNNQIFLHDGLFAVELFVPEVSQHEDMFETADAYVNIEDAIKIAVRHTPDSFALSRRYLK